MAPPPLSFAERFPSHRLPATGRNSSLEAFDFLRELVDERRGLVDRILRKLAAADAMANGDAEVAHRPPDRRATLRIMRRAERLQPYHQFLDLFGILVEMGRAGFGDLERLAAALTRRLFDQ